MQPLLLLLLLRRRKIRTPRKIIAGPPPSEMPSIKVPAARLESSSANNRHEKKAHDCRKLPNDVARDIVPKICKRNPSCSSSTTSGLRWPTHQPTSGAPVRMRRARLRRPRRTAHQARVTQSSNTHLARHPGLPARDAPDVVGRSGPPSGLHARMHHHSMQ